MSKEYTPKDFYDAGYALYEGYNGWQRSKLEVGRVYKMNIFQRIGSSETEIIELEDIGLVFINGFVPATKKDYDKQELMKSLK